MMRAFVTGGSGFIGSHLIDALLEAGWRVGALSHRGPILQADRVEITAGDVIDIRALAAGVKGADAVFHLASAVGSFRRVREDDFKVNAAGTEAVLEAARRAGVARRGRSRGLPGPADPAVRPRQGRGRGDRPAVRRRRRGRRHHPARLGLRPSRPPDVQADPGHRRGPLRHGNARRGPADPGVCW
jgi:hypothetical protein